MTAYFPFIQITHIFLLPCQLHQPPLFIRHGSRKLKDVLSLYRTKWNKVLDKGNDSKKLAHKERKMKKGLIGQVSLGQRDLPFCFINSDGKQSFFCYKSDLPPGTIDGSKVLFDAIPSFDKKKNKESWKAANVRHCISDKSKNSKYE